MPDSLTRTAFEPHQNTDFRLNIEGAAPVVLRLVEVADKTPEGFPGEQFSLLFAGPPEPFLEQRTYTLEHDAMGTLTLFLVPVAQRKDGFRYEAYFNYAALEDD